MKSIITNENKHIPLVKGIAVLVKIEGVKILISFFFQFLDTHMKEDHHPKKVRSEILAFSRNHIISIDFGDLSVHPINYG